MCVAQSLRIPSYEKKKKYVLPLSGNQVFYSISRCDLSLEGRNSCVAIALMDYGSMPNSRHFDSEV